MALRALELWRAHDPDRRFLRETGVLWMFGDDDSFGHASAEVLRDCGAAATASPSPMRHGDILNQPCGHPVLFPRTRSGISLLATRVQRRREPSGGRGRGISARRLHRSGDRERRFARRNPAAAIEPFSKPTASYSRVARGFHIFFLTSSAPTSPQRDRRCITSARRQATRGSQSPTCQYGWTLPRAPALVRSTVFQVQDRLDSRLRTMRPGRRSIRPAGTGQRTLMASIGPEPFSQYRFPDLANAPLVGSEVCQYENTPDANLIVDRHPQAGQRVDCWRRFRPWL